MQRTTGIESDVGGRARTIFWEANEIDMAERVIAASGNFISEPFYVVGFRHFHVYVNRSSGIALEIHLHPWRPFVQTGAPVSAGGFLLSTWTATGATSGVFYFGEQNRVTDAQGRSFLFSPIMSVQIVNIGASPVTIDVWVHAQD